MFVCGYVSGTPWLKASRFEVPRVRPLGCPHDSPALAPSAEGQVSAPALPPPPGVHCRASVFAAGAASRASTADLPLQPLGRRWRLNAPPHARRPVRFHGEPGHAFSNHDHTQPGLPAPATKHGTSAGWPNLATGPAADYPSTTHGPAAHPAAFGGVHEFRRGWRFWRFNGVGHRGVVVEVGRRRGIAPRRLYSRRWFGRCHGSSARAG
jgi:hypothetical protein